jgi:hypothetical protein
VAVLSTADRAAIHAAVMQDLSRVYEPCATIKADLRAAIDAVDQWVSDNAASYNAALPQPARTQLTAAQKTRLLVAVVSKRFLSGV